MKKTFDRLVASLLYCNRCQQAMPVREQLLLVLPDGEMYDYLCQGCGDSLGSKTERTKPSITWATPSQTPQDY